MKNTTNKVEVSTTKNDKTLTPNIIKSFPNMSNELNLIRLKIEGMEEIIKERSFNDNELNKYKQLLDKETELEVMFKYVKRGYKW